MYRPTDCKQPARYVKQHPSHFEQPNWAVFVSVYEIWYDISHQRVTDTMT